MTTIDVRAIKATRSTLGLGRVSTLVAAGISHQTIRRRAADGSWIRVAPGVIDVTRAAWSWRRRVLAEVLASPEGSVASHVTAAALHGIWERENPRPIHVTVPRGTDASGRRAVLHTTTLALDAVRVRGVPATSVPRTLRELAATESSDALGFALRAGLRRGLVRESDIEREAATSLPGARRLRVALDLDRRHGLRTESWLEDRLVPALAASSLPPFVCQHPLVLPSGERRRIDVAWLDEKVALEPLGIKHHGPALRVLADQRRTAGLDAIAWHVEEVTVLDTRGARFERLVATLHELLVARRLLHR